MIQASCSDTSCSNTNNCKYQELFNLINRLDYFYIITTNAKDASHVSINNNKAQGVEHFFIGLVKGVANICTDIQKKHADSEFT